jgi:trehalose 6-phosphate phosphatase
VIAAGRLWLFLDYDGTLAGFEQTPAVFNPDPLIALLLSDLGRCPGLRVVVISGRRLVDLRRLLPVAGIWLAGIYGAEWLAPDGSVILRAESARLRPALDALKAEWQALVAGEPGFYVEDKGLALALHARHAAQEPAAVKLEAARRSIDRLAGTVEGLRILDGDRFLELAPAVSDKGRAVRYILELEPWPDALPIYLGDDDKDEAAFGVIRQLGGIGILVSGEPRPTHATFRLETPEQVHAWLRQIITKRPRSG